MKKTLSNIFDEANANELEKLVSQNAASDVSADTLSSIKNKVYTKTKLKKYVASATTYIIPHFPHPCNSPPNQNPHDTNVL